MNGSRFERQQGPVPHEHMAALGVTVIGVGAIGRQVALQLAALGVSRLQLADFERVEMTNITTQGYLQADLGLAKVVTTGNAVRQIDSAIALDAIEDRYRPQQEVGDVVFQNSKRCCFSNCPRVATEVLEKHRSPTSELKILIKPGHHDFRLKPWLLATGFRSARRRTSARRGRFDHRAGCRGSNWRYRGRSRSWTLLVPLASA